MLLFNGGRLWGRDIAHALSLTILFLVAAAAHDPLALTVYWSIGQSVCRSVSLSISLLVEGRSVGPSMCRSVCQSAKLWYLRITLISKDRFIIKELLWYWRIALISQDQFDIRGSLQHCKLNIQIRGRCLIGRIRQPQFHDSISFSIYA